MTDVFGVDVSHYQPHTVGFAQHCRDLGASFAWIKNTAGSGGSGSIHEDPYAKVHHANFGAVGMARGPYHFYDSGVPADQNAATAVAGWNDVGGWELPLWLDVEQGDNLTPAQWASELLDCLDRVAHGTGEVPWIYTYAAWWNAHVAPDPAFGRYGIAVARYPSKYASGFPAPADGEFAAPPQPWATDDAWQWSTTSGTLDRDKMTAARFSSLTHPIPVPPKPNPPTFPGAMGPGHRGPHIIEWKFLLTDAGYGAFVTPSLKTPDADLFDKACADTTTAFKHLHIDNFPNEKGWDGPEVGPETWQWALDVATFLHARTPH